MTIGQPPIEIGQLDPTIQTQLTSLAGGSTGQVLTWSGSGFGWAASTSASLAGLTDVTLSSPTNGQVLTFNGTKWVNQTSTNSGTVTSVAVTGSTGLAVTGSPITVSGSIGLTLSTELQNVSAISADGFIQRTGGVYQGAALTSGQVTTALGFTPYNATNPSGYISGNQNITLSGDVTGSGTTVIAATLAATGVTAGTYNNVTVNAKGLATGGTNVAYLTSNQAITISGDASGSGATAITLTLASTGVTANTYTGAWGATQVTIPSFTVDAKGRLTSASTAAYTRTLFTNTTQGEVPASGGGTTNFLRADGTWSVPSTNPGTVTSVAATTSSTGLVIGGSPITSSGTLTFTLNAELQGLAGLSATGFVQRTGPGAYSVANLSSGQVTTALGFTPVANIFTINTTAPLIGGANLSSSPLNLSIQSFNASGGALAGYVAPNGTQTATHFLRDDGTWAVPVGTVTSVDASGGTTGLTFSGGPITTSGVLTLAGTLGIPNGGTGQTTASGAINALVPSQTGQAGNFLTTNGTVVSWAAGGGTGVTTFNTRTGAVVLNSTDVTTALGYTPLQNNQITSLSGDATGASPGGGTNVIPVTLATVNANVGTFGSSSQSATVTVNAKGLVTAASNTAISPNAIGAATISGSNATGTWGINISGNAATATTAGNGGVTSVTGTAPIVATPTTGAVVLTINTFGSGASGVVPASGGGTVNFLRADGTWAAPPPSAVTSVSGVGSGISVSPTSGAVTVSNTGVTSLAGTANQVSVSAATGAVTLTLPQNIGTANTPTFAGVTMSTGTGASITGAPTTYSSLSVSGSSGGYAGIQFPATTNNRTFMVNTSSATSGIYAVTSATWDWYFQNNELFQVTSCNGAWTVNGVCTATSFNSTSDVNWKTNVVQIGNASDIIKNLRGVRFNWKEDGTPSAGLIAQEVEKVMPELVTHNEKHDHKTLNYNGIVGVLVEASKEHNTELAALRAELAALRAEIAALKAR